ncbi:hypothetical protein Tco_0522224 [Tanacetum coccineum]
MPLMLRFQRLLRKTLLLLLRALKCWLRPSNPRSEPRHLERPSQNTASSEDDDNACYEIPNITHIRSTATIPTGGNQSGGFVPFAAEGPSNRAARLASDLNQARGSDAQKDIIRLSPHKYFSYLPPEFASFSLGGFRAGLENSLLMHDFSKGPLGVLLLSRQLASAGFERGLSMDQTQDRLAMALKKISHFVLRRVLGCSLEAYVWRKSCLNFPALHCAKHISVYFAFPPYLFTFVGHVVASFTSGARDEGLCSERGTKLNSILCPLDVTFIKPKARPS